MSTSRQGGVNEELQPDARPDDRLMETLQTIHEGSQNIIRSQRVRDPRFQCPNIGLGFGWSSFPNVEW